MEADLSALGIDPYRGQRLLRQTMDIVNSGMTEQLAGILHSVHRLATEHRDAMTSGALAELDRLTEAVGKTNEYVAHLRSLGRLEKYCPDNDRIEFRHFFQMLSDDVTNRRSGQSVVLSAYYGPEAVWCDQPLLYATVRDLIAYAVDQLACDRFEIRVRSRQLDDEIELSVSVTAQTDDMRGIGEPMPFSDLEQSLAEQRSLIWGGEIRWPDPVAGEYGFVLLIPDRAV